VRSVDFYPHGAKFIFQVKSDGNFDFDLPGAFSPESVRCLTRDKLSYISIETAIVKETKPETLLPLEDRVDEATRTVKLLEGRKATLAQSLEMLRIPFQALDATGDGQIARLDGKALIEYIADAQKMRLEIETELVDVDMRVSKAQEALLEAQRELETQRLEIERKKPVNHGTVVQVRGTVNSPSTLLFEAYTQSAGWNVGYEMDMDSATGNIDAKMSAVVWQGSGIDVDGQLAFHTRQPTFTVTPPELQPLVVGLRQKETRMRADSAVNMSAFGLSEAEEPRALLYKAVEPPPPAPDTISTLASVSVRGLGRVGGDKNQARISLGEFSMKSLPVLISIPEQNQEAWIVASVDSVPESVLPGVVELAVDGASTGRTNISDSVAGMMHMPFGMISRLTSKKTPFVGRSGSTWTGTGTLNDGYTIEITSALETEREVTIRDRVPIPAADKIVLEIKRIDPEPAERDKENRLTWRISVKPGETRKITVEYALRYPGDESLEYR
jgi:uncharacterized protein (TIGR02231 family)